MPIAAVPETIYILLQSLSNYALFWKFGWETTIIFESKIYFVFAHTYIRLSAAGSPVKYFLSTAMTGNGDWLQEQEESEAERIWWSSL